MANTTLWSIDEFWQIMNFIKNNTSGNLTEIERALAKAEQAKSERYFATVIDQVPFRSSADYARLRNFLRDLYSTHKTLGTTGQQISDPRTLPNSHLDELFRSFGYPHSTQLRSFDETAPELKVNLFLDLVNLYKIKGTPRSIFEALQYYGLDNLDIYEFWVEKASPGKLIFRGDKVIGTTSTTQIILPFDFITVDDPHWFQTSSQILALDQSNLINLPSKTPYIGVQPIGQVSSDVAIVARQVADQYNSWQSSGTLPTQNAEVSEFGITVSLLELYLACIYQFNKIYTDVGIVGTAGDRYFCYDGTSTNVVTIGQEWLDLSGTSPQTRAQILTLIDRIHDQFYRLKPRNFLQTSTDAGTILNTLNSSFKSQIDAETDSEELLASLLKDLANWVRINVGVGFVTYSLVVGGVSSVLADLQDVVNFFKPYRARSIILEGIEYDNRALNTIVMEDLFEEPLSSLEFRDYVTGDSQPCCTDEYQECLDATSRLYYSRNTYDCGSYHDIGAVVDGGITDMGITQELSDILKCGRDGTAEVSFIRNDFDYVQTNSTDLFEGFNWFEAFFGTDQTDSNYVLLIHLENLDDTTPSQYDWIITTKENWGFRIDFSGDIDSNNYRLFWKIERGSNIGTESLVNGDDRITVSLPVAQPSSDYRVGLNLLNTTDANPSIYKMTVVEKTTTDFTVQFSGDIDSNNYILEWSVLDDNEKGSRLLPTNSIDVYVPFVQKVDGINYSVSLAVNDLVDGTAASGYSFVITDKTEYGFTVKFSDLFDSSFYTLDWAIEVYDFELNYLDYTQYGEWRSYDNGNSHDCTHGFDECNVLLSSVRIGPYLLLETDGLLLLEDDGGLLLE